MYRPDTSPHLQEVYDRKIRDLSGEGRFSGRQANNMNQYFRKHNMDRQVESMQVEFPYCVRGTDRQTRATAETLTLICQELLSVSHYNREPRTKII